MLYNAYPLRLVVVDSDGRIAIDSDFNPSQPFPWKKISDWLDRQSLSFSVLRRRSSVSSVVPAQMRSHRPRNGDL